MARRLVALAFVSLTVAILAADNWPVEAPATVAAASADIADLPVMYD
jgi:hypothetical protein